MKAFNIFIDRTSASWIAAAIYDPGVLPGTHAALQCAKHHGAFERHATYQLRYTRVSLEGTLTERVE